jgi:hypothetical protein
MDCFYGVLSQRTGHWERRTNFGWVPALDLTPVSEMSLGKGDLTGLFCGNYASGRGR